MFEKLSQIIKQAGCYAAIACVSLLSICNARSMAHAQKITQDDAAAVIFVYHRIGEDQYPASNLRLEQFKQHIEELKTNDYNVMSLSDVINAFKNKEKLPDRTVAITFEGAFKSTLENAIPTLLEEKLPFTLFVAPSRIDWQTDNYMTWSDLKKLKKNKYASLGLAPAEYSHIVSQDDQEVRAHINKSIGRFREELDLKPQFFSYPFGEYSNNLVTIVQEYAFDASFGQHSGVSFDGIDLQTLPRFSMTESFAGIDRFKLTANALPLPVMDLIPEDLYLNKTNPPKIGFTVRQEIENIDQLSCFVSGQGKIDLQKIGQRVEIRLEGPFIEHRTRINCTMPAEVSQPGEDKRWRWFGLLFTNPDNEQLTSSLD